MRDIARRYHVSSAAIRNAVLTADPVWRHYRSGNLSRHRDKEHTRETIAFGRHATVQMHRAWIFVWDP